MTETNSPQIRNTTADMGAPNSPDRHLMFAVAMHDGSADTFIAEQERNGQRELVASQMLPTAILDGTDADFTAVGFTFGEPVPGDTMFRPATLPPGWTKSGSDHDMWSYVIDDLGRRRISVFYKAAFYDRSAHMRMATIRGYVYDYLFFDGPALLADDSWATPAAIAAAALEIAADLQEKVDECTRWMGDTLPARIEYAKKYLPQHAERHAKAMALAEQYAPETTGSGA